MELVMKELKILYHLKENLNHVVIFMKANIWMKRNSQRYKKILL
ncbi:unnamed protein product [Paramecium primaurelia]|uniref:Uncharacterized protein n=1 Tax=Paramecium primaurelia TaxID=5886 RepID=A0A8S1L6K9_PARPR|nr:unnamed protein product [Paramecium primaurelia]